MISSVCILVPMIPVHTFISCSRHCSFLPCSPGTGAPAVVQALSAASSRDVKISCFRMVTIKSHFAGESSVKSFAMAANRQNKLAYPFCYLQA